MKKRDQSVREQDPIEPSAGVVPTVSIPPCPTVHLPECIHHRMPRCLESSEDLFGRCLLCPPVRITGSPRWQRGAIDGSIRDKVEVPHDDQAPSRAWLYRGQEHLGEETALASMAGSRRQLPTAWSSSWPVSVDQGKPVPAPPYSTPHNPTIWCAVDVILKQNKFRVWTTKYEDAHPCSVTWPQGV
jgi:hypothetical protein